VAIERQRLDARRSATTRAAQLHKRHRAVCLLAAVITCSAAVPASATTLVSGRQEAHTLTTPTAAVNAEVSRTYHDSTPSTGNIPQAPEGAPNIVIFLIDDMGFSALSTFGGPIPSPALDTIAEQGLRYNDFHTTAQCSPTRAALLSGRNHHSANMGTVTEIGTGFDGYSSGVPNTAASIATVLKHNGLQHLSLGQVEPDRHLGG